jgi:hypothetical protein
VPAVRQHLDAELAAQPVQSAGEQAFIAQEDTEASERLEVLDQVVAAHVGLQVPAQEAGVRRQLAAELRFQVRARYQVAMQAAPRPGPQRRWVRQPGVAAPERAAGPPRAPQAGEQSPRGSAVRVGGEAPGPVPVVQVEAPELRGVVLRVPVEGSGHAEQGDLAGCQLGRAGAEAGQPGV